MDDLKIKIKKKIFISEDTGFGVFNGLNSETQEEIVLVGELFDISEGDMLQVEGKLTYHKRFGEQFKVEQYRVLLPDDSQGIKKYLIDRIEGIGKKTAEKIVDHFGVHTFDILDNNIERLTEIKGLRKTVLNNIRERFSENRVIRELTRLLSSHQIGRNTISKLYNHFGEDVLDTIRTNPYFLIDHMKGIGFKTADNIARGFGIDPTNPFRLHAGVDFILNENEQKNGNLYLEMDLLQKRAGYLLSTSASEIEQIVDDKIDRNEIIREVLSESDPQSIVLRYETHLVEKEIAGRLKMFAAEKPNGFDIENSLTSISDQLNIQLADEQQDALHSISENGLTIVTGGPGTGKTTLIRIIIELFMEQGQRVKIAAPTGRAAKRIEETSGYSASTIHRMLKIDPETGRFTHHESNPLNTDLVIIDESSMIDTYLFLALLRAIASRTRIVLIGDRDQLPSVGPGNVLRDLIHSERFKTIFLKRNFRQEQDSLIIENAYRINRGEPVVTKSYSDELDFVSITVSDQATVLKKIINIYRYYEESYSYNGSEIQVLVPMYRGEAGISNINSQIQMIFNPNGFSHRDESRQFKKEDKVMQLKNNYEKDVFNGEQGIIAGHDEETGILSVEFDDRIVEYDREELDELSLAYAVSVHKSQGSEYDMVILVLLPYHQIMLNREIFYTAVTRAKKKLFLISDPQTIQTAISNSSPTERKTLLEKRIRE